MVAIINNGCCFFVLDDYDKRIQEEEQKTEEFDTQVKEMQRLVAKQRKEMGGYVAFFHYECKLGEAKNLLTSLYKHIVCGGLSEIHRSFTLGYL